MTEPRPQSSATGDTILSIQNLTVMLPDGGERRCAVEDVSFDLRRREILCVVGESGSGKSVMAQAVMGLLPPSLAIGGGRIRYEGRDLLSLSQAELRPIRGRHISMIFQEPATALDPVRTVGDQVAEMIRAHEKLPSAEVSRRTVGLLRTMNLPDPDGLQHAYPFRLSGGQQQRVMIAIALALKPSILIADEPTTALDVTTQSQILELIKDLQTELEMSVLFVTHDMGVVAELANRIVVMRRGRLIESGEADQVLHDPQEGYTRDLIAAVPRLGYRHKKPVGKQIALNASHLSKTYRAHGRGPFRRVTNIKAVDDVSFTLCGGETLGIIGESGSGKSTVARCLMRLTTLDDGVVQIGDVTFSRLRGRSLLKERRRIQMIFQDPFASLNPRQRIETIVGTPLRVQGVSVAEARERSRKMLMLVGLDEAAMDRYPHEFSGGQRQRIGIARALVVEPDVIVADEAVSSLDVSVQAQVLRLLADIKERLKVAMIFITHDLRVATQVCDRVVVMQSGRIVEEGETQEVFARPQHSYTRTLLAAIPGRKWLSEEGLRPSESRA